MRHVGDFELDKIVSQVVQEKNLEYPGKVQFEILREGTFIIRIAIKDCENIKRALSNLINNALESYENGVGLVTVKLTKTETRSQIEIQDRGKGIPSWALARLGERGFSFEKTSGTGLGLHHARELLASLGGNLEIESTLTIGTTVQMQIPFEVAVES